MQVRSSISSCYFETHDRQPSYAFSIAPMYPKPSIVERFSPHGRWRPPKAFSHNLSLLPALFSFDGNKPASTTTILSDLPLNAGEHKTYSIYYDRAIVWTVDYDATLEQVNDGNESSPPEDTPEDGITQRSFESQSTASSEISEPEDGDEQQRDPSGWKDDWAPFKFDHEEHNLLSYAGRHQPHSRLCIRRSDQEWAKKLLPDSCSAQNETDNKSHGGLIGELPLLIGLMALAVPAAELEDGLCEAMTHPWTAPQFEREAGCKLNPDAEAASHID